MSGKPEVSCLETCCSCVNNSGLSFGKLDFAPLSGNEDCPLPSSFPGCFLSRLISNVSLF